MPQLVSRKGHLSLENRQTSDMLPTDRPTDLTIQSLLGGASVTNGLEFEPAWLCEPSEPGNSRMQSTKRRIEQFSVHTSCSKLRFHMWM